MFENLYVVQYLNTVSNRSRGYKKANNGSQIRMVYVPLVEANAGHIFFTTAFCECIAAIQTDKAKNSMRTIL